MGNGNFKPPKTIVSSGGVGLAPSPSYADGIDYPIFCFKHLHKDYSVDHCIQADKKFPKGLIKTIKTLSDLSWTQIQLSGRQGVGSEKIARSSILPSIPSGITKDVKDFLSFYFAGNKGRLIGYRNGIVFHIVYIDVNLSAYSH